MPGPLLAVLLALAALPDARPEEVGLDPARLAAIDTAVAEAITAGHTPGAVVLISRHGKVAFRKAYGRRQVQPTAEAMTADTLFDLASLTKPVATATAVMLLVERGKLRLDDRVATRLPTFGGNGKERVSVEQLLLHTSGLPAGSPVDDYASPARALERIGAMRLRAEPGTRFTYSDVGFIVLGQLVEKLAGEPLDVFTRKQVFVPLGMTDTGFGVAAELRGRVAPTEKSEGKWLRGVVHDPRARRLGGVAGHAGLFGTADDLAVYGQMLLEGGRGVLKFDTVRQMTTPRDVPGGRRTPGWDVRSGYSSNRGALFGGFGHTGFTGTSLWIDPVSRTVVVVLCNRVHPDGKGNATPLRARVATLAARAIVAPPLPSGGERPAVLTGIDVLARDGFQRLAGRRIGLVTNHTGVDAAGVSTIDRLHQAPGVKLVALFSPEHGIRGAVDAEVADSTDARTGLPVYSLYGKRRRPTAEQLKGIDTLVFDIQDIGCRFYTYITTLGYVLEAAAEHKLRIVVLDRPNPIGEVVEGPVLDGGSGSFVAYHPIPVRHGMTVGELARLFNGERKIGATLEVVPVENWRRDERFDRTGLTWVNPSPNMRSLAAALVYPGIGLLETTNVSVGRGTDRPFEVLGAPWIDGGRLAAALNAAGLPGVRFVPTRFTPTSSTHAKKECGGVQIYLTDWSAFESLPTGFTVAATLRLLYPETWQAARYNTLLGQRAIHEALQRGDSAAALLRLAEPGRKAFLKVRQRYLLY